MDRPEDYSNFTDRDLVTMLTEAVEKFDFVAATNLRAEQERRGTKYPF
jgi:hypothetical protein